MFGKGEEEMTLILSEHLTEANAQFNMAIELIRMNLYVEIERYEKGDPKNRFDICVLKYRGSRECIGIIEMKREVTGTMSEKEWRFWNTEQGMRYRRVGNAHKIPVMYCAGPSEIYRVAREMKRALTPWFLRWLV